jgi:hypothetical protein
LIDAARANGLLNDKDEAVLTQQKSL